MVNIWQLTSLLVCASIRTMKLQKLYIISLIIVMLSAISFDVSSVKFVDTTVESKIEVSLEEKKAEKSSEKLFILSASEFLLQGMKVSQVYHTSHRLYNQLYLNDIFKPPIFS